MKRAKRIITSKLNSFLWNKNVTKESKKKLFQSLVESTEILIWVLNKHLKRRIYMRWKTIISEDAAALVY